MNLRTAFYHSPFCIEKINLLPIDIEASYNNKEAMKKEPHDRQETFYTPFRFYTA